MIRTFLNGLFSLEKFGNLVDVKWNVKLYLEVVNVVIDVVVVKWRDLKVQVQEEVSRLFFKTSDFEAWLLKVDVTNDPNKSINIVTQN